ncbi:hypothetical protein HCU40_16735 [Pseudanabaena biceps]|nr:hypothetical protein [Pseudanabaena biceps]
MDLTALGVIGGMGWLGILARNYSTEMIKIAIEKQRKENENQQERLDREREQFDIVFQNLLTRVNEERDTIQAILLELRMSIDRSAEVDRQIVAEMIEVRMALTYSRGNNNGNS